MADYCEQDTVIAPSTPPGRSALAVVRLSGPATLAILEKIFRRRRGRSIPARRPVLGFFHDAAGQLIDEGMATFFPAPRSFTGEDLAELSLHGSPPVVRAVLAAGVAAGARPANPGEFTLRALRRGKLDLTQVEAIGDLVEAATIEQARIAVRQLDGEVSATIAPLAEEILDLLADVEAGLDFAEEEAGLALSAAAVHKRLQPLKERLQHALEAGAIAAQVREGARVVLHGPPNAGKSSLFNALSGTNRVIVSEEPGTTRDLIEEVVVIEGQPVVLVDAAGIGESRTAAEAEGIRRAREAAGKAAVVLHVFDLGLRERPPLPFPLPPGQIAVGTHADLPYDRPTLPGSVVVSSKTGTGIDDLRRAIAQAVNAPGSGPLPSVALATERHRRAGAEAAGFLESAGQLLLAGAGAELVAVELRGAVGALWEILGVVGPEELLGRIFSRFCIGK